MTLEYQYKVRIAVHGLIPLTREERLVKDTQAFQRLRRIRQLALTSLVYPSATHTRFDHSLGAMHVAGTIAIRLGLGDDETRIVRLAALLHDIGHGPLSHVSEDVIDRLTGLDKSHEYYGAAIVRHSPEIANILSEGDRIRISELIVPLQTRNPEFPIPLSYQRRRSALKDIVSGPADADKMDYLLRDGHHCGVKYGIFDLDKVVNSAVKIRTIGEDQLGFEENAVWALEQMILARHHMHRQVYGHVTRAVTDVMLVRAFEDAIESGTLERAEFDWSSAGREPYAWFVRYLAWDDERFLHVLEGDEGSAGTLARRLRQRELLKNAFNMELQKMVVRHRLPEDIIALILERRRFTRERTREVESSIANALGLEERLVFLSLDSVRNPTYRPPAYRMEAEFLPEHIMLQDEDGRNIPFARFSEIFGSAIAERNYLNVYCPMDGMGNAEREDLEGEVERVLVQEIHRLYEASI